MEVVEEEETELDFACRGGQLIAIYADETEQAIRFWIAEAVKDISKPSSDEELFPIHYYKAIDKSFTSYKLEKGRRTVFQVKYCQCLGTVATSSREKSGFQITPMERDRIQQIAVAEDHKLAATNLEE